MKLWAVKVGEKFRFLDDTVIYTLCSQNVYEPDGLGGDGRTEIFFLLPTQYCKENDKGRLKEVDRDMYYKDVALFVSNID
jgi:hypothetical protein